MTIPNYQELKLDKISDCKLNSYHFFKTLFKKEIGKENNYIFNFKDNYLNDMSKIDKEFFEDFYKFDQKDLKMKFDYKNDIFENKNSEVKENIEESLINELFKKENDNDNFTRKSPILNFSNTNNPNLEFCKKECQMDIESHSLSNFGKERESIKLNPNKEFIKLGNLDHENAHKEIFLKNVNKLYTNRDLVYEFAIYHPLKNNKTQEILIIGNSYLHQLKDKIYCVLDEIHSSENNDSSFFFIESCFYNDTRNPFNKILSSKILENKIRKLNYLTPHGNPIYNTSNKHSNLNFPNFDDSIKFITDDTNKINNNIDTNQILKIENYQKQNFNNVNTNDLYKNNNEFLNQHNDENVNLNSGNSEKHNINNFNQDLKFAFYNRDLYSIPFYSSNEIYDEISMNEKKINEINFRIGYPYLFRHIDHCDHMIMLTDIRFLDECDRFDDENKCFVTFQKKLKRRICDACSFYYAKFISINDKITPDYKVLFYCESCLKKIHSSEFKDPSLQNTLKLIPYFHD